MKPDFTICFLTLQPSVFSGILYYYFRVDTKGIVCVTALVPDILMMGDESSRLYGKERI